ncbi:restriction endonuclease subunit S [Fusicatenibacter saccharivorans]|uniref:restriction endonuclease subunit S n=1 Tax=Fusicatenibacter saccharivorans TaxID=1150298 RepID=UPI00321AF75F
MREMKDSGISWINEIPGNWNVEPIKYSYRLIAGATPESTNADFWDGDIKWITPADFKTKDVFVTGGSRNLTIEGYKSCSTSMLPIGSIVFSKRAPIGTVAITADKLCTNQGCLGLVEKNGRVLNKFYFYVISIYGEVFNLYGSGTTFKEISANTFANIKLPMPPIQEQKRIVGFLDAKCAEIDALTADIQTQTDILEQYKSSVITEAVTRGLNPDVEMKDSGTPWCPLIPIHWKYANPKALFTQRLDRAYPGDKQLTASQEYGVIYQDEYMELTGTKIVTVMKDFSILKHVEPNDFVISMRSFQGGLEYSERRGSISSAYVMLIPNNEYVYPPFYRWFFKSSKYINAIQSTSNLVRDGQAMRYANFVQVPLFIIPLDEQKQISEYLDEKVRKIDELLKSKNNQLEILAEYKKSLIYEYVTGKKEVPENA